MTHRKGFTRRQVLAGSAALGAAAMMRPRFSSAAGGSTLKVRDYSDIEVLDPMNMKSAPDNDVMRCIFNGLVRQKGGDDWAWELDAAQEIKQLDDKHIAFTLKPGIVWSNGFGEMSADDVKFSYERIADPKNESPYKDDWAVLDKVEVKDKLSGVIVLKEAFAPLWLSTLPTASGMVLCKAAVEKAGGKFTTTVPASSGPYMIKDWQPKQKTTLARNPDWKGDKPDFDEVEIFPIDDDKTAELGFEAGDIDFTWVSVSSIGRLEKTPPKGGKIVRKPSLAYVWMGMNNEAKPFDNQKVRRAVQLAVDVPGVLDAAYFGAAAPSTGIIAPGLVGHREKNLYGRDVAKAKALLAEAGMPEASNARSTSSTSRSGSTPPRRSRPSSPRSASRSPSSSTIPAPSGRSATRSPAIPGRRSSSSSTASRWSRTRAGPPYGSRRSRSACGTGSAGTARSSASCTRRRWSSSIPPSATSCTSTCRT